MSSDVQTLSKKLAKHDLRKGEFQPTHPAERELMAKHFTVLAKQDAVFALASVFSGKAEQAGYFARCAFQKARSVALLEEYDVDEVERQHKVWCAEQAARKGLK